MNWSYLAGLFDGEGSVTLHQATRWFIQPNVCISTNSKDLRDRIGSFLSQSGIKTTESSSRNPSGRSARISVYIWGECKGFAEGLLEGGVIEKRLQLKLLLEAVSTWEARRALSGHEYISRMDGIRHRLHDIAKKGPKELKQWRYPPG